MADILSIYSTCKINHKRAEVKQNVDVFVFPVENNLLDCAVFWLDCTLSWNIHQTNTPLLIVLRHLHTHEHD